MIPNLSLMTLARGAKQFVVHEALLQENKLYYYQQHENYLIISFYVY